MRGTLMTTLAGGPREPRAWKLASVVRGGAVGKGLCYSTSLAAYSTSAGRISISSAAASCWPHDQSRGSSNRHQREWSRWHCQWRHSARRRKRLECGLSVPCPQDGAQVRACCGTEGVSIPARAVYWAAHASPKAAMNPRYVQSYNFAPLSRLSAGRPRKGPTLTADGSGDGINTSCRFPLY